MRRKLRKCFGKSNRPRAFALTVRLGSNLITSSSDLVTLQTTEEGGRKFSVHKALLCHYSPYFNSALNGNFSEAKDGLHPLAINEQVVTRFIGWLYTRNSFCSTLPEDRPSASSLYIFADRYDVLALRRDCLNMLSSLTRRNIITSYTSVVNAYGNLPESSPYLRALEQTYICKWTPDLDSIGDQDATRATAPSNFLAAVMVGKARRNGSGDHRPGCCCYNVCRFHEHESDEEREASKPSPF